MVVSLQFVVGQFKLIEIVQFFLYELPRTLNIVAATRNGEPYILVGLDRLAQVNVNGGFGLMF